MELGPGATVAHVVGNVALRLQEEQKADEVYAEVLISSPTPWLRRLGKPAARYAAWWCHEAP